MIDSSLIVQCHNLIINNAIITARPSERLKRFTPEKISNHAHVKRTPNENNEKKAVRLSRSGKFDAMKLRNQTIIGRLGFWKMTTLPFESLNILSIE